MCPSDLANLYRKLNSPSHRLCEPRKQHQLHRRCFFMLMEKGPSFDRIFRLLWESWNEGRTECPFYTVTHLQMGGSEHLPEELSSSPSCANFLKVRITRRNLPKRVVFPARTVGSINCMQEALVVGQQVFNILSLPWGGSGTSRKDLDFRLCQLPWCKSSLRVLLQAANVSWNVVK